METTHIVIIFDAENGFKSYYVVWKPNQDINETGANSV